MVTNCPIRRIEPTSGLFGMQLHNGQLYAVQMSGTPFYSRPYSVCMQIFDSAIRRESYSPLSRRIAACSACRTLHFVSVLAFQYNLFLLCSREKILPTVYVMVEANGIEYVYPKREGTASVVFKVTLLFKRFVFRVKRFNDCG